MINSDEFKRSSLILQACIVVFVVATAAGFVAFISFFSKMSEEIKDTSASALFILLGIQNLLSLISGLRDGAFLLMGKGQPLIRHEVRGSTQFRKLVIVNSIFIAIAVIHVVFTYLRPA